MNTTSGGADHHKQVWVQSFAAGVNKHHPDWSATIIDKPFYQNGFEFAFVFGYQSENDDIRNPVQKMRLEVMRNHAENKTIFMDSDVLIAYQKTKIDDPQAKLKETEQGLRYVRIPFGHVYRPKAKHFIKPDFEERWKKIRHNKNIIVRDYLPKHEQKDRPILLVCNRGAEGYGGGGKPAYVWAADTLKELKQYTDRKFIVRFHKANIGDKFKDVNNLAQWLRNNNLLNIQVEMQCVSNGNYPDLISQIQRSYAVVTYASSAAAPAIIEGRPLFVTSPTCFFYDDRSGELKDIEKPKTINRNEFFKRYAFSHWNVNEIRNGDFWRNVKYEI